MNTINLGGEQERFTVRLLLPNSIHHTPLHLCFKVTEEDKNETF